MENLSIVEQKSPSGAKLRLIEGRFSAPASPAAITVDRVAILADNMVRMVNCKDIIRLEADGNYTHIYITNDQHFLITKTLRAIHSRLPSSQFIRTHRSHVVNPLHIDCIRNMEEMVLSDKSIIQISRSRKKEIKQWLDRVKLY